ncbi:hypothetical protein K438DRAFT_773454 [Mycena galopus ATCC 62051]|nr:hypothetical protein K438DRAFT_773454 [Mycena galopus ATCC 62051]
MFVLLSPTTHLLLRRVLSSISSSYVKHNRLKTQHQNSSSLLLTSNGLKGTRLLHPESHKTLALSSKPQDMCSLTCIL